jgi:hypothetical protein
VSADLDQTVYALLTPVRFVIDRHGNDGSDRCHTCGMSWPCSELGTAIEALDLVLRVHVAARRQQPDRRLPPQRRPPRPTWGPTHAATVDDTTDDIPAPARPA